MPVTSDTRNRVVAVPARIQGYNTLDKKIKGLGLRVTPYGRKIWFLQVMHQGKRHYRTLGDMPAMSEIAAREAAPARRHRQNIPDKKIKGFGLRIEPNGRKFWC